LHIPQNNIALWIATCNQQGLRLLGHFSTDNCSMYMTLLHFHSIVLADCVYSGSSESAGKGDAQKNRPTRLGDRATDFGGDSAHPRCQRHHMQPEAGDDQWNHQCPDLEGAFQAEEWGGAAAVGQQVRFDISLCANTGQTVLMHCVQATFVCYNIQLTAGP